jgi:hypothetical protein
LRVGARGTLHGPHGAATGLVLLARWTAWQTVFPPFQASGSTLSRMRLLHCPRTDSAVSRVYLDGIYETALCYIIPWRFVRYETGCLCAYSRKRNAVFDQHGARPGRFACHESCTQIHSLRARSVFTEMRR